LTVVLLGGELNARKCPGAQFFVELLLACLADDFAYRLRPGLPPPRVLKTIQITIIW
jgi:hypothetical protein